MCEGGVIKNYLQNTLAQGENKKSQLHLQEMQQTTQHTTPYRQLPHQKTFRIEFQHQSQGGNQQKKQKKHGTFKLGLLVV